MENKKRSLRLVLLLTLSGFIGLLVVTSQQNGYNDSADQITYGLDVELKWVAEDQQADFAVVQDTLGYYAAAIGIHGDALSSHYQLDHCCDDPALRAQLTGNADFYHLTFSADFAKPEMRQILLASVIQHGYLQLGKLDYAYGMGQGNAEWKLPIPSQPGKVLHIRNSRFELNLVPRIQVAQENEPMA